MQFSTALIAAGLVAAANAVPTSAATLLSSYQAASVYASAGPTAAPTQVHGDQSWTDVLGQPHFVVADDFTQKAVFPAPLTGSDALASVDYTSYFFPADDGFDALIYFAKAQSSTHRYATDATASGQADSVFDITFSLNTATTVLMDVSLLVSADDAGTPLTGTDTTASAEFLFQRVGDVNPLLYYKGNADKSLSFDQTLTAGTYRLLGISTTIASTVDGTSNKANSSMNVSLSTAVPVPTPTAVLGGLILLPALALRRSRKA